MFSNNIVKVEACMAAMKSDKVKEALREVATLLFVLSLSGNDGLFCSSNQWQVTEEAVDRGAFGAPTMFFTEEDQEEQMFWGSDRSHTNPFQYLKCSVYNCTSTYRFISFQI